MHEDGTVEANAGRSEVEDPSIFGGMNTMVGVAVFLEEKRVILSEQ